MENYLQSLEELMLEIRNQGNKLNASILDAECLVAANLLRRSGSFICQEAPKRGQDPSRMSLRTPRITTPKGLRALTRSARGSTSSSKPGIVSKLGVSGSPTLRRSVENLNERVMIDHSRVMRQLQKRVHRLEEVRKDTLFELHWRSTLLTTRLKVRPE